MYVQVVLQVDGMSAYESVISPAYKVPDKLVAETPALRKKTNSIRGTAGVRRKVRIKEIARQKSATKSKLAYMEPPLSPQTAEPAESRPAKSFVVPDAVMPSDDEVLVVVLSPWPLLTDSEQDFTVFTRESLESHMGAVARPPLPHIPRKKTLPPTSARRASRRVNPASRRVN